MGDAILFCSSSNTADGVPVTPKANPMEKSGANKTGDRMPRRLFSSNVPVDIIRGRTGPSARVFSQALAQVAIPGRNGNPDARRVQVLKIRETRQGRLDCRGGQASEPPGLGLRCLPVRSQGRRYQCNVPGHNSDVAYCRWSIVSASATLAEREEHELNLQPD